MIAKTKTRAKNANRPVVKIGGVEVTILSHPGKGNISVKRLRNAVAAVAAMQRNNQEALHLKNTGV